MIDRWLATRADSDIFAEDYSADQALTDLRLHNPDAPELIVTFPHWHGSSSRITNSLINRLVGSNNAVLECQFNDQILEPNVERVHQSFEYLQRTISTELHHIHETYERIHFLGISIGNVALAMTARKFPDFSKATMVLPGSNLAASTWEGIRTQHIALELSGQGWTMSELEEAWIELAPKTNAHAFRGKDVKTIISRYDRVVPTRYQREMENSLGESGSNLTTKYTKFGHAGTIIRFCLLQGKI